MWSALEMTQCFLDRYGCGDELYFDKRQKSFLRLAGLHGIDSAYGADLADLSVDFDAAEEDDVSTGH